MYGEMVSGYNACKLHLLIYFYLDPPSSEGLVYHAQLSTAWLYFINAAIAVFMFLALILIVLNILLRKNKYEHVATWLAM